jgi:site-specific DNA-cytosine methylase
MAPDASPYGVKQKKLKQTTITFAPVKNDAKNDACHQVFPIGTKISKFFEGYGEFEGTVQSFDAKNGWYRVMYQDGDEEDLEHSQLDALVVEPPNGAKRKQSVAQKSKKEKKKPKLGKRSKAPPPNGGDEDDDEISDESPPPQRKTASKRKSKPPKQHKSAKKKAATPPMESEEAESEGSGPPPKKKRAERLSRRARKAVSYTSKYDELEFTDSHDESSEEEEEQVKKPKGMASLPIGGAKRKSKRVDSGEESVSFGEESSSEEEEDYDSSDSDLDRKPSAKKKERPVAAPATKKIGNARKGGKKMSESFNPFNVPLYKDLPLQEIHERKEFLDPCGMECSDDIVERLVGEQVDKLGGLLKRAMENKEIGSKENPLQLGTACSGTDAPALALTFVQEQLEQRGLGGLFNCTHEFSCEVDPFKQGYLERNFDSVLYPDITKLSVESPLDVYGQVKEIPPFNMLVAGTSCKNFSMLRSTRRLDIEDKGCSGETFLGAVEVLLKEKPKFAIFENVTGAPWVKMQEYIRGRIKLSECASKKAIKDVMDQGKDLTFVKDKNGKLVVDYVPAVFGVRAGAVVAGFLRPEETDLNLIKIKRESCTLAALLKENGISRANDTLVFESDCTYCTEIVKVDTKNFGLPQTRQRTYMFVWQPDDDNVHDDLGYYWKEIVQFLQSPVRHSLESFILQDDHDIIRVFREALRGPPGRQTARGNTQEPDFWTSPSANLPHNVNVRANLGLEDQARSLTQWQAYGKKQVPPHYWLEYLKCLDQRRTDLLEILHASALRDAESHDSNFASFYWNISQNASKEKHRSATPGIAGCITPGGDFVIPSHGRALLGCEKLMIQGIPYFRLALGNETEVQLGDLAGNAMSLTVVCATMLAAIGCKELRRETLESKHQDVKRILQKKAPLNDFEKFSSWHELAAKENARSDSLDLPSGAPAALLFRDLASLASEAVKSSVWCTCETSGSNSLSDQFLQCKVCRVSCCRNCISTTVGYNLTSHDTIVVDISNEEHNLSSFQSKLRQLVPPTLTFGKEGIGKIAEMNDDTYRVSGLSNFVFSLHRIKRDRRKWVIIYYARDNNGIGEAVAEFCITVGELQCEEIQSFDGSRIEMGMKGELTSYFPARTKPLVYGPLDACAVVVVLEGSDIIHWKARNADTVVSLHLEGEGTTDSPRVEVGLTDTAAKSLVDASKKKFNAKHYQAAKKRGEERRWLYPERWKQWPEKIYLNATSAGSAYDSTLSGTYERARCRQTINQSALWIKRGTAKKPSALYLLIKPNIHRTGPDYAVISRSSSHKDTSSIVAVLPVDWQPSDALDPESHNVDGVCLKNWVSVDDMECLMPSTKLKVQSPQDSSGVFLEVSGLSQSDVAMLCRNDNRTENVVKLNVAGGQKAQQTIRVFNSVCVSSILQCAARSELKYNISPDAPWTAISPSNPSIQFGCCKATVPVRPVENWYFDEEREIWDRRAEPGAARKYYLALEAAPQPFELWLDKNTRTLSIKCLPEVVAHRAAGQLIEGRGGTIKDEVSVTFRLSDLAQQSDPVISRFKVSNCDSHEAMFVELRGPQKLYERQQKVVSKMLAIEDSKTEFNEIEMSEQEMPGSCGLSLIAKASRDRKLSGGVIADAIGSGKTVISIAMILKGLDKARKTREFPNKSGASLVVVPFGIINQWEDEIEKFSSGLTVVKIFDFNSLKKVSVKQIIEADVVIAPINILEFEGYLERVVKLAKLGVDVSDLQLPPYTGQKETIEALGVWIPANSTDPYGGGNNHLNQQRRTQSAYYTHTYLKGVDALRKRDFSSSDKGVPLEYFEWERVFVDEIHESLCTTKAEIEASNLKVFKEKNRRVGRELLGLTEKDIRRRPLIFRQAIYGLTGTPLLDSTSRVIELANLMGGTYIVGMSSHWRRLERESCRDIFLHNYLEPKQSREVRKTINSKCQEYVTVACCRNKAGEEMNGIKLLSHHRIIKMTEEEGKLYLKSQGGIAAEKQSFSIKPEDFDVTSGHDISKFLRQNASLECRGNELVRIVQEILARKGDERTKIIVFADGRIGAGIAARRHMEASGLGCTYLDVDDSVETKNKKIAWYQHGDATEEDKKRPRVLVLHFEHAAGLNLQTECHDMILFSPLYIGEGGSTSDAVSDASTEQQAIGRVFRPGQPSPQVNLFRIEVRGPEDEECLDGWLIRRNTDKETIAMTINGDE